MKKGIVLVIRMALGGFLSGCETAAGITRDVANTARNIRDILGAGKDISDMAK